MDCNKKCITTPGKIKPQGKNENKVTKTRSSGRRKRPCNHKRVDTTGTEQKFTTPQTKIDSSNKHISQQFHVEKQEFQCIINLNTTICEHKSKHRHKHDRKQRWNQSQSHEKDKTKHFDSNYYVEKKDSIVPECFRQVCANSKYNRRHQEIFQRRYTERHRDSENRVYLEHEAEHKNEKEKRKRHLHHKCKHSRQKHIQKEPNLLNSLSSPLKDDNDNLTYEDVSSSSLETDIERRTSHKCVKRHKDVKHCIYLKHNEEGSHESKLDTLIKRTKERERKLMEQSRRRETELYTSTPIHQEFNSGEISLSCSDMDISFNSRSTLVLETRSLAHSSSCLIEDLHQSSETERLSCRGYSPSSPTRNKDHKLTFSERNNNKPVNIKDEPTMDIEAYSPTHSLYDISSKSRDIPKVLVKKEVEVKSEPLFSPGLSPIYFEQDKSGLQFCKIESVKSERHNSFSHGL